MLRHFLPIYLSGIIFSTALATEARNTKVWYGNTNFHNPHNWNPPHIPCSNNRVIFDSSTQEVGEVLVMMSPIQTTIRELILPYNGEIIFPANGALMFKPMNSISKTCAFEDIMYVGTKVSAWMDPRSWGQEGENSNALRSSPVPHADRIPCQHDKVVFSPGSSFQVILPKVATAIGSLYINGQPLSNFGWRIFAESDVGKRQFIGNPTDVTVLGMDGNDRPCTDPTGCYCGNSGPLTMSRVCSYAVGGQCDLTPCLKPIQPIGHCCYLCGATIQFGYNPQTFRMSDLEDHVQRFTSSFVLGYAGKTSNIDNRIQVVYVDADIYQGRSVDTAKRLLQVLKNDMSLGLSDIVFEESGPAIDLSELSIAHSPEKILGFIFGGVALLMIAFLMFLAYKDTWFERSEAPSFVFSRFENLSGRREGPVLRSWGHEEVEEAQEGKEQERPSDESAWVSMDSVMAPSKPQAFDNPMYNKPVTGDTTKAMDSLKHSGIGKGTKKGTSSTTMENPVYSALKEGEEGGKTTKVEEKEEEKKEAPPPPPATKRKAKSRAPRKGKVKREILSEEDTDDSKESDTMTTVEDLE